MSWKEYIQGLKPTTTGAITVFVCLFVVPIIIDFFFLSAQAGKKQGITMRSTLIHAYIKALPLYFIYLLIYFALLSLVNSFLKTIHFEKFCFRS